MTEYDCQRLNEIDYLAYRKAVEAWADRQRERLAYVPPTANVSARDWLINRYTSHHGWAIRISVGAAYLVTSYSIDHDKFVTVTAL